MSLLFLLPSATAQEENIPLPPPPPDDGQRIEGEFSFPHPAQARADLTLSPGWILHWPPVLPSTAPPAPFAKFQLDSSQVEAYYYERSVLNSPLYNHSGPYKHKMVTLYDAVASLKSLAGPQELMAMGSRPITLQESPQTEWKLSTQNPEERILTTGQESTLEPNHALGSGDWSVLLESEEAVLSGQESARWFFYGFNVTIQHRDGVETYVTGLREAPLPLLGQPPGGSQTFLVESFLVLNGKAIQVDLEERGRPVRVMAPFVTLSGEFDFADLRGRLATPLQERQLDRASLRLDGSFLFSAPAPDSTEQASGLYKMKVSGSGEGLRESSAKDSFPLGPAAFLSLPVALALAGLLFVLWKPVVGLFTRLKPDELLADPARRRIYDAIAANPGITVKDLSHLETTTPNNIRYHVGVLRRFRRIRAFRLHGTWHLATAERDVARLEQKFLLGTDPKVESVVRHLGTQPLPASQLVRHLRTHWGVSRSGAWYLIDRAIHSQLVTKEQQGRRVMLRARDPILEPLSASDQANLA